MVVHYQENYLVIDVVVDLCIDYYFYDALHGIYVYAIQVLVVHFNYGIIYEVEVEDNHQEGNCIYSLNDVLIQVLIQTVQEMAEIEIAFGNDFFAKIELMLIEIV